MRDCNIPDNLHPLAQSALDQWLLGELTDKALLWYATMVNSDNFAWVLCLIGG